VSKIIKIKLYERRKNIKNKNKKGL